MNRVHESWFGSSVVVLIVVAVAVFLLVGVCVVCAVLWFVWSIVVSVFVCRMTVCVEMMVWTATARSEASRVACAHKKTRSVTLCLYIMHRGLAHDVEMHVAHDKESGKLECVAKCDLEPFDDEQVVPASDIDLVRLTERRRKRTSEFAEPLPKEAFEFSCSGVGAVGNAASVKVRLCSVGSCGGCELLAGCTLYFRAALSVVQAVTVQPVGGSVRLGGCGAKSARVEGPVVV